MSNWAVLATTGGAVAVFASATGIAAVVSAIHTARQTPPRTLDPAVAEDRDNNHQPVSRESGLQTQERLDLQTQQQLERLSLNSDLGVARLNEQLEEIREASSTASELRDIDVASLADQLQKIREASGIAEQLKHIDVAPLAQQLRGIDVNRLAGAIQEVSDTAGQLKYIDVARLTQQLDEIRQASSTAAELRDTEVADLSEQLRQIREINETALRTRGTEAARVASAGVLERTDTDQFKLTQLADKLAREVGTHWAAEAAVLGINDPYPLPVTWATADSDYGDSWDTIVAIATSGAGWPPPPQDTWAASPQELAGTGKDIMETLKLIPTGRLSVLGAPGAGKTTLMVRLLLDMLAQRSPDGIVPVLVSSASWDPSEQSFHRWLAATLTSMYPELAVPVSGARRRTGIQLLLAENLILPILDGLDEMSPRSRSLAIMKINEGLLRGEPLVVTSRIYEYREAVEAGEVLRGAAIIELQPLTPAVALQYLRAAAGPAQPGRWSLISRALQAQAPVAQVLSSPLMVNLLRMTFKPEFDAGPKSDPVDLLLNYGKLDSLDAVRSRLFDEFIPAVYRRDPVGRWTASNAQRWLGFIAQHQEMLSTRDIAWWLFPDAIGRGVLTFITEIICFSVGFVGGALAGWIAGGVVPAVLGGFSGGIVLGLLVGFHRRRQSTSRRKPAVAIRWRVARGIGAGSLVGLATAFGVGFSMGARPGLAAGIAAFVVSSVAVGLRVYHDREFARTPQLSLKRDSRTALIFTVVSGISGGLAAGLCVWFVVGSYAGLGQGVASGLIFGAVTGLAFSGSAWPEWEIARFWLALSRRLPWRTIAFLADAHRRGVLREVGVVYQFRYAELQHRLALSSPALARPQAGLRPQP